MAVGDINVAHCLLRRILLILGYDKLKSVALIIDQY